MGEAEIDEGKRLLLIRSHIITYGNAADEVLTDRIRNEIESMWNEPRGIVQIDDTAYRVQFHITAALHKNITDVEVYQNVDPRNNYFRIENFALGNISFVDGLGCNTGYFLLENLYEGSTTAAHEYGHTIGLDHPSDRDIRGKGVPGIMFPRGTLTDPQFQYDPLKPAGVTGGTMHPMYRKVLQADIEKLKLHKLKFQQNKAVLGAFTNYYHWDHADKSRDNIPPQSIFGDI